MESPFDVGCSELTFAVVQLLVFVLCALIFGCFTYEIAVIKPNWLDILKGLIPRPSVRICLGLTHLRRYCIVQSSSI